MTREQVTAEHTAAYDEITPIRGRPPVVDPTFTTSIGYFRMLGLNANAFTVDLPEQRTEPLQSI
jgi:hypothetical protein